MLLTINGQTTKLFIELIFWVFTFFNLPTCDKKESLTNYSITVKKRTWQIQSPRLHFQKR